MMYDPHELAALGEAISVLLDVPAATVLLTQNDLGHLLLAHDGVLVAGSFDNLWTWAKESKRALEIPLDIRL